LGFATTLANGIKRGFSDASRGSLVVASDNGLVIEVTLEYGREGSAVLSVFETSVYILRA
jgi:hypothetical protein